MRMAGRKIVWLGPKKETKCFLWIKWRLIVFIRSWLHQENISLFALSIAWLIWRIWSVSLTCLLHSFTALTARGQICDFETGSCSYIQSQNDTFDWTRGRRSTGSGGTGPSTDHTSSTSSFKGKQSFIRVNRSFNRPFSTNRLSGLDQEQASCFKMWGLRKCVGALARAGVAWAK